MIDILIPIGDFPFLPFANIKNIKQTIGNLEYKINFLVCNSSKRIIKELQIEKDNLNFNLFIFDIKEEKNCHLRLLDLAFRNINLSDWVYVQHSDMFWKTNGWMNFFIEQIDSSCSAIMPCYSKETFQYKEKKYYFKNDLLIRTHDFCGLYRKEDILKNNLTFCDGLVEYFIQKYNADFLLNYKKIVNNKNLKNNDYLDGSDFIGLYFHNKGNYVKQIKDSLKYYHCWDFFGIPFSMEIKNNTIKINKEFERCVRGMDSYSYISSFYFDYKVWKDKIFPWFVLNQIIKNKKNNFCNFIDSFYTPEEQSLKNKNYDIEEVIFLDKKFRIQNSIFI